MRISMLFCTIVGVIFMALPCEGQFIIDQDDFNYSVGVDSYFYQHDNVSLFGTILPFDENEVEWDFSNMTSGTTSHVQILDPTTSPGSSNYPGATGCSKSVIGTDTSYMYEKVLSNGFFWMGYYTKVLGINVVGNFNPDVEVYQFPMQDGLGWNTTTVYTIDILGIPITATETHSCLVVAKGRVKTPDVPYWMPCQVIRTYHHYSDNAGSSDNYWLYEWVVPNGFSGGNGVVSCMFHAGANQNFDFCRHVFVLGNTNITPDGTLAADVSEVSESAGGVVNFSINPGPEKAGRNYLMLGSVSGTSPGTPLPGGMATLPLNWDLLTNLTIGLINTPVFYNFMGSLDIFGLATAQFNTLGSFSGGGITDLYFAYCLAGPFDYASNPVRISIVP